MNLYTILVIVMHYIFVAFILCEGNYLLGSILHHSVVAKWHCLLWGDLAGWSKVLACVKCCLCLQCGDSCCCLQCNVHGRVARDTGMGITEKHLRWNFHRHVISFSNITSDLLAAVWNFPSHVISFSNMASDWLAAQLPANRKLCKKMVICYQWFWLTL